MFEESQASEVPMTAKFEIGDLEEVVEAPVGIAVKDWFTVIGVIVVVAVVM
jgi:hypothetical protein